MVVDGKTVGDTVYLPLKPCEEVIDNFDDLKSELPILKQSEPHFSGQCMDSSKAVVTRFVDRSDGVELALEFVRCKDSPDCWDTPRMIEFFRSRNLVVHMFTVK